MTQTNFNITTETVIKVVFAIIGLYVLFVIKDVIIWFVFALIIAILFNYLIDSLEKKRIPRVISATILYFGVFILLGFFIYKSAPLILGEIQEFSGNLQIHLQKLIPLLEKFGIKHLPNPEILMATIRKNLEKVSGSFGQALASIFGGASATAFVIALAFFISIERRFVERIVSAFSPDQYEQYLLGLWHKAKKKVSGWFIARLIGVAFVGASVFLVLRILNVKYAFLLALLSGIFDFLPFIGPLVMGTVMFSVIALNSLMQAVFVAIAFVIIQQIENHLLFPVLFRRFIGISPVLVLVAFAIGGELWGIAGAILAIPLAGVVFEILKDYLTKIQSATKIEPVRAEDKAI